MAIFSRSTREVNTNTVLQDEEGRAPLTRARGVGQLLREARQSFGREVSQIGITLRIRGEYLEAIETGRYEQLPGPTYAIGFIRTYADYLGLDGAEIVRRFKHETEGLDLKRDLSFPMPLTERSIPGGTILLVALILALCGYGIWYYLSSANHARTERVSSVPNTLLPPVSGTAAPGSATPSGPVPATEAAAAPPSAGTPTAAAPALAVSPVAPSSVPAGRSPVVSETTAYPATPSVPASSTTAANSPPTTAASPLPPVPQSLMAATPNPAPAIASSPVAAGPAASTSPVASTPPAAAPTVAVAPTATPASTTPSTTTPRTVASLPPVPAASAPADPSHLFGATTGPSRIVIRATGISWIQIHDAQGSEVFTRVMRAGDVYRVPDKPGLQLHTGSAGSLEVSVDGKVAPTLGTVGVIRHTVVLDPQRLLAGTAVEN